MVYNRYPRPNGKPKAIIKVFLPHVHLSVVNYKENETNLMFRGPRQLHCYQIEWIEEDQPCKIILGFDLERNCNSHMNLIKMFICDLMEYRNGEYEVYFFKCYFLWSVVVVLFCGDKTWSSTFFLVEL